MPIEKPDLVNHPPHYTSHPSGVECIEVTEHMNFCLGNAVKYIWRADLKEKAIEDLEKAIWYIEREIARRKGPVKDVRDTWYERTQVGKLPATAHEEVGPQGSMCDD